MRALPHLPPARCADAVRVPVTGCWKLMPGRAIRLTARQAGEIELLAGAAWVTLDGPHAGQGHVPAGDLHLCAGERLPLRAGQRLVLEPIHAQPGVTGVVEPVAFGWSPAEAALPWRQAVAAAAADLRLALAEASRAMARLLHGLLSWGGRAGRGVQARSLSHS